MIKKLSEMGVKSDYVYAAALASVGLTWLTHGASRLKKSHDKAQSDRWGIFIATWPPTLFALGTALRLEEDR